MIKDPIKALVKAPVQALIMALLKVLVKARIGDGPVWIFCIPWVFQYLVTCRTDMNIIRTG